MGLSERSKEARRTRVGASEAAALLPCGHPFKTPADIYASKVHGIEAQTKPVMTMGNMMERPIFEVGRQALAKQGYRCRMNSRSVVRDRYVATPDGYCECGGVIECKYVSFFGREMWLDGLPEHYHVQVQLQMAATQRDHAHVWAWQETRWESYEVKADPAYQRQIVTAIDDFFRDHIEPRIPPADIPDSLVLTLLRPEGTEFAAGALKAIGDGLADCSAAKATALAEYDKLRDWLARAMAQANVSELVDPAWTATVGPVKGNPEQLTLTFRRRGAR